MQSHLDRFPLAADAIDRVPRLTNSAVHVQQQLRDRLRAHRTLRHHEGRENA